MQTDIFVTGIGVVSAIGRNVEENFHSLATGKSGIGAIRIFETAHRNEFMVGEVPFSNNEILDILKINQVDAHRWTRTTLLGALAAKEALESSKIDLNDGLRTAFVSSTTVGGMDSTEKNFEQSDNIDFVYTHTCGASSEAIAEYLNIKDYRTTISTACSSGANAIMHAARLIRNGFVDRAVVGGVDALTRFTFNGFNSLMIFDHELCRPFDDTRCGLNLGEGAGFLVLESKKSLTSKSPLCRLVGYANANDAFHQTASSPEGEGAYRAMSNALKMSGLRLSDIDYINVHGTGTENNDLCEGVALKRLFDSELPPFSSTKAFTGHTLAAAAGIEAVFSVLAIVKNVIYPNLNFKEPIKSLQIVPQTTFESRIVNNVMSNSFGFGGNDSSIIFSR